MPVILATGRCWDTRGALPRSTPHRQQPHRPGRCGPAGIDGAHGPQQPPRSVDLPSRHHRTTACARGHAWHANRVDDVRTGLGSAPIWHGCGTQRGKALTTRGSPGPAGLGWWVVGLRGLEPRTSSLSGKRS